MKYTVEGFSQQVLVELNLDAIDAHILRWYVDFRGSEKMASIEREGVVYYWVSYKRVIDDLPVLGISKTNNIARRFTKLVDSGVLRKYVKRSNNGTYTMFAVGEKYDALLRKDSAPARKGECAPARKGECAPARKGDPKDSSIKDSETNNTSASTVPADAPKNGSVSTKAQSLSPLKDDYANRWQEALTSIQPASTWGNFAAERKACNTLASRSRELLALTPYEGIDELIAAVITQYRRLRVHNRGTYWRHAEFTPSAFVHRWPKVWAVLAEAASEEEVVF